MADKFLEALRRGASAGVGFFRLYGVGWGYAKGASVTQAASKSTGVTCNAWSGQITMNNAALAANTTVSFTLTNSYILSGDDEVYVWIKAGATAGAYVVGMDNVSAGTARIFLRNTTGGSLSEAVVLGFVVRKAAIA